MRVSFVDAARVNASLRYGLDFGTRVHQPEFPEEDLDGSSGSLLGFGISVLPALNADPYFTLLVHKGVGTSGVDCIPASRDDWERQELRDFEGMFFTDDEGRCFSERGVKIEQGVALH